MRMGAQARTRFIYMASAVMVGSLLAILALMFGLTASDPGKSAMLNIFIGSLATRWTAVIGY